MIVGGFLILTLKAGNGGSDEKENNSWCNDGLYDWLSALRNGGK